MPLPHITESDLRLALVSAFTTDGDERREAVRDVARCAAVLPEVPHTLLYEVAQYSRKVLSRQDVSEVGTKQIAEFLAGGPVEGDPLAADDGAPDITHADAWLTDACEQLVALAHEHNDDRLMNLHATLVDICERAVILPRFYEDAPKRDDSMDELDASGRDCDGQREQGPDYVEQARELGREAGRNAGSWAADGNTSADHIRKVLAMLDAGDPAADEFLPSAPRLTDADGGYDDDTAAAGALYVDLTGEAEPGREDDVDALADAWEQGRDETFRRACEQTLRSFLPADDDGPQGGESA